MSDVGSPNIVFGHRTNYLHRVVNSVVSTVSGIYGGGLPRGIRERLFNVLIAHIQSQAANNILANLRQLGVPTSTGEVIQYGQLALDRIFEFLEPAQRAELQSVFSGMPRAHRLQTVTQSPLAIGDARGKDGLASRVATIQNNLNAAARKLYSLNPGSKQYKDQQEIVSRLKANILQWKTALDGYTPAATPTGGAEGGPEDLQPPNRRQRLDEPEDGPANIDHQTQLQAPETREQHIQEIRDDDGIDEEEFQRIGEQEDAMASASNTAVAGAMGTSAMQGSVGRIGKNKPYFSPDGSTVIFSGNRLMYTWAYNFADQNPLGNSDLSKANFSYGDNELKPLGFDIPWDWIPFYCTPAEWDALDWGNRKIEIDHVEITVTPHAKTVCFTTGSTDSNPVSTEYDCYVYKAENLHKIDGLMFTRGQSASTAIDWKSSKTLLKPVSYQRLKERFWGAKNPAVTGVDGRGSDVETVKRELETVLCLNVPKTKTGLGDYLWGEIHDTFDITAVMNKPFIHKRYKPVVGLVCDPRRKAMPLASLAPGASLTTAPYYQQGKPEVLLSEFVALFTNRFPDCETAAIKVGTQDDAIKIPSYARNVRQYHTVVNANADTLYVDAPSYTNLQFMAQVASNTQANGNYTNCIAGITAWWDNTYKLDKVNYGCETYLLKDYDLPVTVSQGSQQASLSTYNSKIERANAFIPAGADTDVFPKPCQVQEPICIGMKPVLASDPNTGNVAFLKGSITWLIEYKMVLKQTYIAPDLRRTEPIANKKADYSFGVREHGYQLLNNVTQLFKKTGAADVLKSNSYYVLNPMEEDTFVNGSLVKTVRTARPADPMDGVVYNGSLQKNMTALDMNLNKVTNGL